MAYPFAPGRTFFDLRTELVQNFGCTWQPLPMGHSPRQVSVLERTDASTGAMYDAVMIANDGEMIPPSVIGSICRRLHIDPAFFGLTLAP